MPKKEEPTIKLQRHLLGSIDLSDLDDKIEQTEDERKAYCSAIFSVFPRLEKDLKKLMYEQLLYSSNEADTWERVIFSRGSFNGMALLLEHWQKAQQQHLADIKPKEGFDKNSPLPEV